MAIITERLDLPYLVLADCQCGGRHVELTSSHARTSQLAGLAGGQGRQERRGEVER